MFAGGIVALGRGIAPVNDSAGLAVCRAIRQDRPDYVLLWGWGVMNSTAIKEAAAVGYPRDKIIGVWWSGAEPDVTPAGEQSKGYKALMLQHPAGRFAIHAELAADRIVLKGSPRRDR